MPRRLALMTVAFALASKIFILLWAADYYPFGEVPGENAFTIWNRWDGAHYTRIAEAGYSPEGISPERFRFLSHFPPFYPLTVAAAAFLFRISAVYAALLISFVSGLAAAYLLALLAWHEFKDERTVIWSNVLFHVFPVSYFLITSYSESLFFLLVLGFFYQLRVKERYAAAASCAALSVLTRLMGVNLIPVLFSRLAQRIRAREIPAGKVTVALLPAASVAGYLILNRVVWGDWLYFLHHVYEDPNTPRQPIIPFRETIQTFHELLNHIAGGTLDPAFMNRLGWGAVFTIFAALVTLSGALFRVLPGEYTLYSIFYLSFYSSFAWGISNARYSYGAFPIFFVLARLRPGAFRWIFLVLFTSGLLYFSKRFVWGYWAF